VINEMNEIENWIVRYFEEADAMNGRDPARLLDVNYFNEELLDSLGIVQLVTGLEDEFDVRLEPEQMQDPRFCTIRGLAQIVDESR